MPSINDIKINQRKFKKNMRKATYILERELPKKTLDEAKRNTPKDNGNARRKTELVKDSRGKGFEIRSNYPYGQVIDEGKYGKPPGSANGPKTKRGYSTQAPQGIYAPTSKFVKRFLRQKFRRF